MDRPEQIEQDMMVHLTHAGVSSLHSVHATLFGQAPVVVNRNAARAHPSPTRRNVYLTAMQEGCQCSDCCTLHCLRSPAVEDNDFHQCPLHALALDKRVAARKNYVRGKGKRQKERCRVIVHMQIVAVLGPYRPPHLTAAMRRSSARSAFMTMSSMPGT